VSEPAHQAVTRHGYDTVAETCATVLPGLDAEAAVDIAMIDEFAARCAAGPPGVVADLGCGTGRVTAYLARSGLAVRGFDLSPGMVAVARRRHPNLDFAVAATQALPVDDAAFAGLSVWYSLIHTPPEELGDPIGELARVLQPGGHLLIGFQAGHGERVDRTSSYGHHVAF